MLLCLQGSNSVLRVYTKHTAHSAYPLSLLGSCLTGYKVDNFLFLADDWKGCHLYTFEILHGASGATAGLLARISAHTFFSSLPTAYGHKVRVLDMFDKLVDKPDKSSYQLISKCVSSCTCPIVYKQSNYIYVSPTGYRKCCISHLQWNKMAQSGRLFSWFQSICDEIPNSIHVICRPRYNTLCTTSMEFRSAPIFIIYCIISILFPRNSTAFINAVTFSWVKSRIVKLHKLPLTHKWHHTYIIT